MAAMARHHTIVCISAGILLLIATVLPLGAQNAATTALGIDVDFYTGPISRDVWLELKAADQRFAIAQAWGGRSRNEYASMQLAGARTYAGMKTAAYVLLNYDNKVCPTFSKPVRNNSGRCIGEPVSQPKTGARWQVRQGIAGLGSEFAHISFIAIDVEWFLATDPPKDRRTQARHRQYILDAYRQATNPDIRITSLKHTAQNCRPKPSC